MGMSQELLANLQESMSPRFLAPIANQRDLEKFRSVLINHPKLLLEKKDLLVISLLLFTGLNDLAVTYVLNQMFQLRPKTVSLDMHV